MEGIVIAEKMCHKGSLFGHVSNGGGLIELGNGKYLKFIALNEKFVTLQLIESGIGAEIKTQSWQKSKIEKPKKPEVNKLEVDSKVEQKNIFEVTK